MAPSSSAKRGGPSRSGTPNAFGSSEPRPPSVQGSVSAPIPDHRAASPTTRPDSRMRGNSPDRPDSVLTMVDTASMPMRFDRRMWPTKDVRGPVICEQGFTKSINSMGHELLEFVSEQVKATLDGHTRDFTKFWKATLKDYEETLKETAYGVDRTFEKVKAESERRQGGLAEIAEELRRLEEMGESSERRLAGKLGTHLAQLEEDTQAYQQRSDQLRTKDAAETRQGLHQIQVVADATNEISLRVDTQLLQVVSDQKTLRARADKTADEMQQLREETRSQSSSLCQALGRVEAQLEVVLGMERSVAQRQEQERDQVQQLQEDEKHWHTGLQQFLEGNLSKHLQEQTESLEAHFDAMGKLQTDFLREYHCDFRRTRHDFRKIQQALHIDFAKEEEDRDPSEKRVRNFMTQTEDAKVTEIAIQTDLDAAAIRKSHAAHKDKKPAGGNKKKANLAAGLKNIQGLANKNPLATDAEAMKRKMRAKMIKPTASVKDYYSKSGVASFIAKSQLFEQLTFVIIFLNAFWLSIDADHNDADMLKDADPIFILVENVFCVFFTMELLIRFAAFEFKRQCYKDPWFLFDLVLVTMMILETWVLVLVLWALGAEESTGLSNLSILRVARIAKMFRLARMARLLRLVPELVIIMTGIGIAARSVFFFSLLLLITVYVYGVALRQLTKDTEIGQQFFRTVPWAMNSLVLEALFPEQAEFVNQLSYAMPGLYPIILSFVVLAGVTIMYMLVGVLVEVVRAVSATEQEKLMVMDVSSRLRDLMDVFSARADGAVAKAPSRNNMFSVVPGEAVRQEIVLTQREFEDFLADTHVARIVRDVGVDVEGLLDMSDLVFENAKKEGLQGLNFEDFIELILNMRGTNPVTVKDVNAQLRIMKSYLKDSMESLRTFMQEHFMNLRQEMDDQSSNSSSCGDYRGEDSVDFNFMRRGGTDARDGGQELPLHPDLQMPGRVSS